MLVEAAAPLCAHAPPDRVEAWVRGRERRAASAEAWAPAKLVSSTVRPVWSIA